jgi:hypothetical protein
MKHIILFHREHSRFERGYKMFESGQEVEITEFINKKAMAGLTCEIYDHRDTFQLNKTVKSTNTPSNNKKGSS